jgi:hypothetical protein
MATDPRCDETLVSPTAVHLCSNNLGHASRRLPSTRDHYDGRTGVSWPAAPRASLLVNDGPRWQRPDSGFDMIGTLDRTAADDTTARTLLLAAAQAAADTNPLDANAAALTDRFQDGTPRLSYDETKAFAALVTAHADPDHRERLLSTLGYLSAVNGIPGTWCTSYDSNGDKCGRSNHHRGDCRH